MRYSKVFIIMGEDGAAQGPPFGDRPYLCILGVQAPKVFRSKAACEAEIAKYNAWCDERFEGMKKTNPNAQDFRRKYWAKEIDLVG